MPNRSKKGRRRSASDCEIGIYPEEITPASIVAEENKSSLFNALPNRIWIAVLGALLSLLGIGVMAKNGWMPHTDGMTGKKTGWFGRELRRMPQAAEPACSAPSSATPQLSKEYIYAGSRMLAVEDANANAAPPADLPSGAVNGSLERP